MRRVDIAHSGQTVDQAIDQLIGQIKRAQRDREEALLVVHGYGASGAGGAINNAVTAQLPGLAARFRFKVYRHADRHRLPDSLAGDGRHLNPGSTILVFTRPPGRDGDATQEFRPNYRTLRKRVVVRRRPRS